MLLIVSCSVHVFFKILQHSANLQEANEKSFKTLSDKCYLYGNAIDKIIEYNLESMFD